MPDESNDAGNTGAGDSEHSRISSEELARGYSNNERNARTRI